MSKMGTKKGTARAVPFPKPPASGMKNVSIKFVKED